MARIPVIMPTDAEIELADIVEFDTGAYDEVAFTASGLAGGETFVPYVGGSAGWTQLYDEAGAPIIFDATHPQRILKGGVHYGFTKDATAGDAALDANLPVY